MDLSPNSKQLKLAFWSFLDLGGVGAIFEQFFTQKQKTFVGKPGADLTKQLKMLNDIRYGNYLLFYSFRI